MTDNIDFEKWSAELPHLIEDISQVDRNIVISAYLEFLTRFGKLELLKNCIEDLGFNINDYYEISTFPEELGFKYGNNPIFYRLMEQLREFNGENALLLIIAFSGNKDDFKEFLNNIKVKKSDITLLSVACLSFKYRIAKFYIERGMKPNEFDLHSILSPISNSNLTPTQKTLKKMLDKNKFQFVKMLVENGARITEAALIWVKYNKEDEIIFNYLSAEYEVQQDKDMEAAEKLLD